MSGAIVRCPTSGDQLLALGDDQLHEQLDRLAPGHQVQALPGGGHVHTGRGNRRGAGEVGGLANRTDLQPVVHPNPRLDIDRVVVFDAALDRHERARHHDRPRHVER